MNIEMNILKALAIIAMVVGHSRGPYVGNVYLYHMALFVFVSGYFYKDSYSYDIKSLILNRFKSLYVPFLKFNVFILVFKVLIFENILLNEGNGVINDFILGIKSLLIFNHTDPLISAFWFLKSLFYVNIIFCCMSFIIKKYFGEKSEKIRFIVVSGVFIIFYILAEKEIFISGEISFISRAFIINIFFYFGFLYKKYEENLKGIYKLPIGLFAVFYIVIAAKYDSIDFYTFYFSSIPFLLISSIVGIYMNIYIAKIFVKNIKSVKTIEYIGKNSLWILAYHLIFFKLAILIKIKIYNLDYSLIGSFPTYVHGRHDWMIDTVIGIVMPIVLCIIYNKMKYKIKDYLMIKSKGI